MKQLTLSGKRIGDPVEDLLGQYKKLQRILNDNYSLLLSPLEFCLNRKPGVRTILEIGKDTILYDKETPYFFAGPTAESHVDTCKYSTYIPKGWRYKTKKEYVYVVKKVLGFMDDPELKSLRADYKKCVGDYSVEVSTDESFAHVIYEQWKVTLGTKYFQIHDSVLHNNIFKYWEHIKDYVILIYLKRGDDYVGFALYEKTGKAFIYSMSRKTLEDHIGATTFFHIETIKKVHELTGVTRISDGGADKKGLSFYKEKFHPETTKTYEVRWCRT